MLVAAVHVLREHGLDLHRVGPVDVADQLVAPCLLQFRALSPELLEAQRRLELARDTRKADADHAHALAAKVGAHAVARVFGGGEGVVLRPILLLEHLNREVRHVALLKI